MDDTDFQIASLAEQELVYQKFSISQLDADDHFQLALLASLSEPELSFCQKIATNNELSTFHKKLSDSANQLSTKRSLEHQLRDSHEKSKKDQTYNFFAILDKNLVIDVLGHICKYLPLLSMARTRLVSHDFANAVKLVLKSETIYLDSFVLPNLFQINMFGQYEMMKTIWSTTRIIYFECPPMYGIENKILCNPVCEKKPSESLLDYEKRNLEFRRKINPPNLTTLIVRANYAYQLQFLTTYNLSEIALVIQCCPSNTKCKICNFHEIAEWVRNKNIKYGCKSCTVYHNNSLQPWA
jgi:hypothetical protein